MRHPSHFGAPIGQGYHQPVAISLIQVKPRARPFTLLMPDSRLEAFLGGLP
jgi:hypothetical protein